MSTTRRKLRRANKQREFRMRNSLVTLTPRERQRAENLCADLTAARARARAEAQRLLDACS